MPNNLREALQIVRAKKDQNLAKNELVGILLSEMDKMATRLRNELLGAVSRQIQALPRPKDGKDGENSPKLDEIMENVLKKLPELIKEHSPKQKFSIISAKPKSYFKIVDITGTKDGTNRKFFLSEAPLYGSQVFVFLNGQYLHLNTHYEIKGVSFTYKDSVSAPKANWNHYAIVFRP